ncbi:nicotinate (nicotinamide) nucleotide adenylyltransferase [Acanthocheilonema viteae]|uniref:Nicotinamide/nicotinic acid mononucleotide adenylyltransferase 3 n=1 Tax=Acanthocheilonema viteae TaxID=6277 RepID=A0A498S0X6_ACAVI|nr:unnamed protein product [Acanthocheilonema viteae]
MEKSSDVNTSQVTFRKVALLSCGTFNPPTYMHLRMFERARDYLKKIHGWEVVEGIMSPVADNLGRPDMVPAKHRLKMVELATKSSSWIRADGWECSQGEWIRTIHVLHHFKEVLNCKYKSENCKVQLLLLCGGDVIESFTKLAVSDVMLWNTKQVEEVVRDFGVVVVMRANTDPISAIYLADVLHTYQKNIFVIEDETCPNDISSTRLRTAIRRKESIRYCTSDEVIQYIGDNSLYGATSLPAMRLKMQNICKSASSSNISASNTPASFGSSLKHPKLSLSPPKKTIAITEGDSQKEEKQSFVMESSPIWYPSGSLPEYSLLTEKLVSTTHSMSHLQKTLPILIQNKQCSAEINNDTTVPKQSKHAHFRSLESSGYHNLTSDKMLTASSDWVDYLGTKKDELTEYAKETDTLMTPQVEQANLQMKMLLPVQRKNYEMQTKQRLTGVSRSIGNLATELSLEKEDKSRTLSHVRSEERSEESNNVTLIYRKYKLASTPETTV